MEFWYSLCGVFHVIICVLLIFIILMQKTTESGLFASSSMGNSFMSGSDTANALVKVTKYIGILFFANTLCLASLSMKIVKSKRIIAPSTSQTIAPKDLPSTTV